MGNNRYIKKSIISRAFLVTIGRTNRNVYIRDDLLEWSLEALHYQITVHLSRTTWEILVESSISSPILDNIEFSGGHLAHQANVMASPLLYQFLCLMD